MSLMHRLAKRLGLPTTTHPRPLEREAGTHPTTDTPETNLGAINAPRHLRPYFADFLRERRAVLVIEAGLTPRQANAEARRLLRVIQEREEGARHAR